MQPEPVGGSHGVGTRGPEPQGLKPASKWGLTARLKPRPDTNRWRFLRSAGDRMPSAEGQVPSARCQVLRCAG